VEISFLASRRVLPEQALSGRATQAGLRVLDWLAKRTLPAEKIAAHHQTGRRGEEAPYFQFRRLGYTMVARNFRSPRCRGEIDLIGWEDDIVCFVEVKTRTTRDVKPGKAPVDRHRRAPGGGRGAEVSAALSTIVPVALRCGQRIL
jgi:hypothetical protein